MSPTRPATPMGIPTPLSFSTSRSSSLTSLSLARKPSIPLLSPSRIHLPASPAPSPALKSSSTFEPSAYDQKSAYRFAFDNDNTNNYNNDRASGSERDPDETSPFHFDDHDTDPDSSHEQDTISGKSTVRSHTRPDHSRQSSSFTLDLDLSTIEADPPALHLPLTYGFGLSVDPAKTPLPESPVKMHGGDYIMAETRAGPSHRSFSPTRLQQSHSPHSEGSYRPGEQRVRPGRRPASAYASEEPGMSAMPSRKFTDPSPFSQYQTLPQHAKNHGLDLSAISHEFDDDSRAPTLSFVTTATADSTTSTPSLSNSYGGFRPDPMEHFKEATEPRMRIRATTGRAHTYSSAGSSGAYSGYGYDNGMYDDAPPIPVIPPLYTSIDPHGSPLHPDSARASSPSDSFRHRPWKSDLPAHSRAESDASSITSISDDPAPSAEEEYHFVRYELSDRMPWEDEEEVAEPMALMSLDGHGRIFDRARLQSMGGLAALTEESVASLRGFTHLLLPRIGSSIIEYLHLLLGAMSPTLLVVDLSDNDLAFLPEALQRCSQLEELNLSGNPLRKLPPWIGSLINLRMVMLDGCALQGLPGDMAELRQMHTLCVRRNRLVSLPPFLCLLDRLEVLRIEENPFAAEWERIVAPIIAIPTAYNRPFSPHAGMSSGTSGMRETSSCTSIATTATDASDGHGPIGSVSMQAMSSSVSMYQQPSLNSIAEDQQSMLSTDAPRPSRDTQTTDEELALPQPSFAGRTVRKMRSAGSLLNLRASGTGSSSSVNATLAVSPPMTTSVSIGPSHGRRMSFANNRESVVPAEAANMGLTSSTSRFGKLGFLRKMSMKSLKTDKAATISASASANIQHLPPPLVHQTSEPGPSRPSRPARPTLQNAFTASALPTRSALGDVSEFGESPVHSRAPSPAHATLPSGGIEPASYTPLASASTSGKRAKRRSFLPIDPAPPSISVSIPPTSPFMPPVNGFRPPSVHAIMTAARSESTIVDQTFAPAHDANPERDLEAEKRYADGLNSIKSYLRDLYDLSRPLMAPYGGFAVMPGQTPTDGSYASSMADSERPNTPASGGLKSSISQRRRRATLETTGSRCVSSASVDQGSHFDQSFSQQQYEEDALDGKKFKNDKGKRARVLREIYETERTYVRSLGELVQIYVRPASVEVKSGNPETVIPAAERKIVFGGVESILSIHKENLLPALEKAVKPLLEGADDTDGSLSAATAHQVGGVFRTYIAYMKQYSTYINNFDNALSRMQAWDATSAPMIKGGSNVASLAALSVSGAAGSVGMSPSLTDGVPHSGSKMNTSQTKRVKAFLKAAKKHPLHSQINLESYLLLPVQRVPRYKLLLEDLAMCTPPLPDSPRDTLDDALNEIASLASLMNEEKRDAESRLRLFYWQKRIASKGPSPLVQPHRKLIMDGSLQLIRLVKKASTYVEVDNTILGDGDATVMPSKAVIPVESIKIEPMNRSMIILLCSDLLVLAQPRVAEGQEGQVDLYHVMRMSTLKEPASANGNVLRVVDHKTIYYFVGTSADDALQWSRAINTAHGR